MERSWRRFAHPEGLEASPGLLVFPGVTEVLPMDITNGFHTTLMAVNAAEQRDGLLFILGGGWESFSVPHIPYDAVWQVVSTAKYRLIEGQLRGMFLSLVHPTGHEVARQILIIPTDAMKFRSYNFITQIGATFDTRGLWKLIITLDNSCCLRWTLRFGLHSSMAHRFHNARLRDGGVSRSEAGAGR